MKIKTMTSLQDSEAFAIQLANLLFPGSLITMTGDLGAGKTTITKSIGKALGVKRTINSPTFTILKSYKGTNVRLHHIDAYRLEGISQDLGFEEIFEDEDSITIVEWPQYLEDYLPTDRLHLTIKIDGDTRIVEIEGIGQKYKEVEDQL